MAAIQYLGRRCSTCKVEATWYNQAIFEFHHKNSATKDFTIGSVANKSWAVIKLELDKCELLCSNCHQMQHSDRSEQKFLEEASKYGGGIEEVKLLLAAFAKASQANQVKAPS